MIKLHPRSAALAVAVFVLTMCTSAPTASGADAFFPHSGDTSYDVDHYDVAFSFDSRAGTIDATETIEARATQSL